MDDRALIRILRALGEPQRLRMLQELAAAGELSCGEVGARFPLSQPTISHHLKVLDDAGLLVVRREGKHAFVSLNQGFIDSLLTLLPGRLMSEPPEARREHKSAKRRGSA